MRKMEITTINNVDSKTQNKIKAKELRKCKVKKYARIEIKIIQCERTSEEWHTYKPDKSVEMQRKFPYDCVIGAKMKKRLYSVYE